ncbi:MAG: hypothetical protein V1886_04425 [archaeon]
MFEKQLKRLKLLDMALVKLAIAAIVLFIVGIWPTALFWVLVVNPWYFFAVSIVSAAIVLIRVWKK